MNKQTNKRGTKLFAAPRRVITCTAKQIQEKLTEKYNISVSKGTILKYKSFYISYATEKERIMCMCGLCLNTMLILKAVAGSENESPTKFLCS